jgi:hypothetical protein
MNLFGFDVSGLEVSRLVGFGHLAWWLLSLLAVWFLVRTGRRHEEGRPWRVVLALAVFGHGVAWFVTMFPLPNVYGTNASMDRENHLGWAQVIVAGNSPIRSFQVNQLVFEPLWPNLVAVASLYRAELVGPTFQIAPLVVGILFMLSVFASFSRGQGGGAEARMEGAFAAFFAVLLASAYTDQTAPFRYPWALTFMLKPNHALGLVLMPWVLLAVTRAENWKQRLWAGFLLQLLGWAFVIHMAYVISGLMVFVVVSWLQRRPERWRNTRDVAIAIAVNLIVVSPYLYILTEAFNSLGASPRFGLVPQSAHTFDATLRLGLVFPLAVLGAWSLARGPSRFGQALSAQFVAAQINWQIYLVLGLLHLGREMDEALYWVRFMTALVAGIGLWRLGRAAALGLARLAGGSKARVSLLGLPGRGAVLLGLAASAALPGWWDPESMDRYFPASLQPTPARVDTPTTFIRNSVDPQAVVAGDRVFARYVAAFGGRRVLLAESLNPPRDTPRRAQVEAAITRGGPADLISEGRARYGIRYLLVTPLFLTGYPGVTLESLSRRADLRRVFDFGVDEGRVTIFELVP